MLQIHAIPPVLSLSIPWLLLAAARRLRSPQTRRWTIPLKSLPSQLVIIICRPLQMIEQIIAPRCVKLAHHIVEQHNRIFAARFTINSHSASLSQHSFAAVPENKCARALPVKRQIYIVAVRSGSCHSCGYPRRGVPADPQAHAVRFRSSTLLDRQPETAHTALKLLASACKTTVNLLCALGASHLQKRRAFLLTAPYAARRASHISSVSNKLCFIHDILQQPVSLVKHPCVLIENMDIFGLDLTNRRINKTPLFLRPVFTSVRCAGEKQRHRTGPPALPRFQQDLIERSGAAFFNRQKRLLFASGRINQLQPPPAGCQGH